MGLAHDQRKFTPHVTLARLRESYPREVADYLAMRGGYRSPPFLVSRFVLYSSRNSTGGGPYVTEAAYPLDRSRPLQEATAATI
jgi:2'-5' RNA ligase